MADEPKTAAPPVPPGQEDWPDDAKVHFLNLRARGMGRHSAYKKTRSRFKLKIGAQESGSFIRWMGSEAACAYLDYLKDDLKRDFKKLRFAKKWERVATLGNLALSLLERFEIEDLKGKDANHGVLVALSKEIRPTLSEIHSQTEGLGLDDAKIVSLAETIERRRKEIFDRKGIGAEVLAEAAN